MACLSSTFRCHLPSRSCAEIVIWQTLSASCWAMLSSTGPPHHSHCLVPSRVGQLLAMIWNGVCGAKQMNSQGSKRRDFVTCRTPTRPTRGRHCGIGMDGRSKCSTLLGFRCVKFTPVPNQTEAKWSESETQTGIEESSWDFVPATEDASTPIPTAIAWRSCSPMRVRTGRVWSGFVCDLSRESWWNSRRWNVRSLLSDVWITAYLYPVSVYLLYILIVVWGWEWEHIVHTS